MRGYCWIGLLKLKGMISIKDLVKTAVREKEQTIKQSVIDFDNLPIKQ